MTTIHLTRALRQRGFSPDELGRLVRTGELTRVRRGAYAPPGPAPDSASLEPLARHLRLLAATVPQLSPEAVVSHVSAAVLHELPVWPAALERVHLTRDRSGGGRTRRYVQLHGCPLAPEDVVSVAGFQVTSLARTVLDLGCWLSLDQAVAAGDAALRRGLDCDQLTELVGRCGPRRGVGAARRTLALLDARSESPEESRSRVLLHLHGVPAPVLQFVVRDEAGRFVARCDFGWPELRTVGEFDGRVKYGRLLRPDQQPGEVVHEEKLREDAVRDLDWQMVRWTTADLTDVPALAARLERAFRRGRR